MHTLPQTLLDAQRAASAAPVVQAVLSDRWGGVARLAWERLYDGTEEDSYHGAALTDADALLRARFNPVTGRLEHQRVASPGPGSNFSVWQDLGAISPFSGIAMAARSGAALLFSVALNQRDVTVRESADDGATFGSAQLIWDPGSGTSWLAAAYSPVGTAALFFTAGGLLYWTLHSGVSWTTPQGWPHVGVVSFTGLACRYLEGDWRLVVCGQQADGASRAWTCIFGDGGAQAHQTWSLLREVIAAAPGSSVTYRTPGLAEVDGLPRLSVVEKYTGPGAYTRTLLSYTCPGTAFADNRWREPVPFDLAADHGPAYLADASHAWLTTPDGVWRAAVSPQEADVSADVLRADAEEDARGGRVALVLDNARSGYAPDGGPAVRLGAELRLSWGYRTAAGEETAPAQRYWVRSFERRVKDGRSVAVIEAGDAWSLLDATRLRRQRSWASGTDTVLQVLEDLLAMVGLTLSVVSASPAVQTLQPAFTVLPNEGLGAAVRRLLALVPDSLRFADGVAELLHLQASDPSVYAYGPDDHRLLEAADRPALASVNRVQVYGAGVLGEALSWTDVEAVGDRLWQVIDAGLTTDAQAADRADAELRRRTALAERARVAVPVNCGQQLHDVVSVTEPALGWAARPFRVSVLRTRLDRSGSGKALYRQDLSLSDV
jgi:hypothetical protein